MFTTTRRTVVKAAWAGAEELKSQCHRVIQTLGPAAPPEVFLFRGNAYYAAGFPYLALADYENASRFLTSLSPERHQDKCWAAVKHFPPQQRALYAGECSHLHICVNPLFHHQCRVFVNGKPASEKDVVLLSTSSEVGSDSTRSCSVAPQALPMARGVFATSDIPAGSPILSSRGSTVPWLRYPLAAAEGEGSSSSCSRCGKPLQQRVFACANERCHEEYCSRDCRQLALQEYHAGVCTNEAFQALEMSVIDQLREAEDIPTYRSMASRLLTLRVLAAALLAQSSPTALPQLRILSSLFEFSPAALCGEQLEHYQQASAALRIITSVSYEEYLGVLSRVHQNAFWHYPTLAASSTAEGEAEALTDCCGNAHAIDLHLPYAMMNHSCEPSVVPQSHNGGALLDVLSLFRRVR